MNHQAGLVQTVGRLPCKQDVGGSTPSPGSISTALADGGYRVCLMVSSELPRTPDGCAVFFVSHT